MARFAVSFILLFLHVATLTQEDQLKAFDPFLNKTWQIEGKWGNAMDFKQETTFRKALEGNLIIAESKGYINEGQTQWGDRNHGIRRYDAEAQKLKFYEYDVFGGFTEGEITIEGKDLLYIYTYEGQTICDKWEYVNENEYKYIVGTYGNGRIQLVLLEGKAKVKND